MAHRLGGARGKSLNREERLEKLINSAAYGGEIHTPLLPLERNHNNNGSALRATVEPCIEGPGEGRNEVRNNSMNHVPPVRRGSKPPIVPAKARAPPPPRKPNIHTLNSSNQSNVRTPASTRSRLHNTTEAYRQNRGTTARTIEEVGRDTMTQEKAEQVARAREKVLTGSAGSSARSNSCGANFSRRVPAPGGGTYRGGASSSSSSSNPHTQAGGMTQQPPSSSSNGLGQRANVHTLSSQSGSLNNRATNTCGAAVAGRLNGRLNNAVLPASGAVAVCAGGGGAGGGAVAGASASHPLPVTGPTNGIIPIPTSRRRAATLRA